MLRLAIQHVNRLKPRFLLISGDLTNAWPTPETREIVTQQISSIKEVPSAPPSCQAHPCCRGLLRR